MTFKDSNATIDFHLPWNLEKLLDLYVLISKDSHW